MHLLKQSGQTFEAEVNELQDLMKKKKAEKAMERSEMMLDKFENLDKLQKSFEVDEDAQSVESNEIQIIDDPVIKEVEPVQKTQIDNQPLDSQVLI